MSDYEQELSRRLDAIEYWLAKISSALEVRPKAAYTVREAVAMTGIGRTTLYEEVTAGRLVARKRGSSTMFLAEELTAYLQSLPKA